MKSSLARRPQADAWSVEDLLDRVRDGHIRLPEFQRLFKWGTNDVSQLFDSIIRGFPIGTLLFWRRPAAERSSGRALETGLPVEVERASDLLWILDGQQRITSLAGVLLNVGAPEDERFRIAFDLEGDEVIQVKPGESWPPHALPLFQALDSVDLMTWLGERQASLNPAKRRRALEIGKSIREYQVPAYIVASEDEGTARLIFDRTNSTGKELSKTDVFRALQEGLKSQQPNSLDELQRSVEDLEFGKLRDDLYLQAAAAVADLDSTQLDHGALANPAMGKALPRTAAALRQALVFLRQDAHIPNQKLLPYGFPVIALTKFFDRYPTPNPRSRELLSRWVWRGALTKQHWSHEYRHLRKTLEVIRGGDEETEVQRLLELVPRQPLEVRPSEYNLRSAETRLQLLALLELRPRDLATHQPLDGPGLIAKDASGAIPALTEDRSGDPREDAARASVFGRVIQKPMTRSRMFGLLQDLLVDDELLASLGLDRDEVRGLLGQNGGFSALRREDRLRPHVESFFERRARWTLPDRPSLASMVVEDGP